MKIKEIIEKLNEFDEELPVAVLRFETDDPVAVTDVDCWLESSEHWDTTSELYGKTFVLLS